LFVEFSYAVDKVQENTEFYWRYQRYTFIREYFERPPLAYPPLIIVPHILLIFWAVKRRCCPKLCQNEVEVADRPSGRNGMVRSFSKN
jgi:hypothetical protein